MTHILNLPQIKTLLQSVDVIATMEEGFMQYSNGKCVVPPVGELILEKPPGEVHIKYGYIKDDDFYVVKIASGFYDNPKLGLPSGQGMMLVYSQKTGEPVAILLDEGHLTDVRTAAAGALAAKYFAPKDLKAIGIIGTGIQARLQLQHIQKNNPCKTVWLWGRNLVKAAKLKLELGEEFDVHIAQTTSEVAKNANLIVTTTPSEIPLLKTEDINPGTTIIAVGSDTREKQELESGILSKADIVISDSIPQSKSRGEIYQVMKEDTMLRERVVELGTALLNTNLQRTSDGQIVVVDLTGVAVQDIMIASAVYNNFLNSSA